MPNGSAKFRSTRRELSTKADPEKRISQRERRSNIVSRAYCIAFVVCCVYIRCSEKSLHVPRPTVFCPFGSEFYCLSAGSFNATHDYTRISLYVLRYSSFPSSLMPSLYPLCQLLFRRTCTCETRVQPHFCGRRDHPGYTPRKYERDYF